MSPLPVYSPSQTDDWQFCPMYRLLIHWEKLRPIKYGKKEVAGITSHAIHAGLALYYSRPVRDPHDLGDPSPLDVCRKAFAAEAAKYANRECVEPDMLAIGPEKAVKAVSAVIAQDPVPRDWTIVAVEPSLPDWGYARPDLVVRDPHRLAIIDWKYKTTLKSGYDEFRILDKYEHNGHPLHYAWAYGAEVNERITRHYLGLIIGEPTLKVKPLQPFEIDPDEAHLWLQSRRQVWADMAAEDTGGRSIIMRDNTEHYGQFGKCEMHDACFKYKLDPQLWEQGYIREE